MVLAGCGECGAPAGCDCWHLRVEAERRVMEWRRSQAEAAELLAVLRARQACPHPADAVERHDSLLDGPGARGPACWVCADCGQTLEGDDA